METMSNGKLSLSAKYDISPEKLEPAYIDKCQNIKELERILKVLRSGEEGLYPHLEDKCVDKIERLNPKSRILRKETPLISTKDADDKENIANDLKNWMADIKNKDRVLSAPSDYNSNTEGSENLPPVRGTKNISTNSSQPSTNQKSNKAPMPKSYKEWDKIIANMDEKEEKNNETNTSTSAASVAAQKKYKSLSAHIDTSGMSDQEKEGVANREKDKGNEAFRSGDFQEAIAYYNRSLNVVPVAATFNNRALAYIRISKWTEAVKDCDQVLEVEPTNLKAKLRRACAYKSLRKLKPAKDDLQFVLQVEPNNKRAQDMMQDVEKELARESARKTEGRGTRMVIEETDGESSDEEQEEIIANPSQAPQSQSQPPPTAGGGESAEELKQSADQIQAAINDKQETSEPKAPFRVPIEEDSGSESSEEEEEKDKLNENSKKETPFVNGADETDGAQRPPSKSDEKVKLLESSPAKVDAEDSHPKRPVSRNSSIYSIIQKQLSGADLKASSQSKPVHRATSSSDSNESSRNSSPEPSKESEQNKRYEDQKSQQHSDDSSEDSEKQPTFDLGSQHKQEEDKQTEEESAAVAEDSQAEEHTQVIVVPTLPAQVETLKTQGNEMFKAGQYGDAVCVYTRAINILSNEDNQGYNQATLLSNRAACHLKTGDCRAAINDCTEALDLTPHNAKALLRRATAYETMERYVDAYVDFRHVTNLDSNASNAFIGASRCEKALSLEHGHKWRALIPKIPSCHNLPVYELNNLPTESSNSSVLYTPQAQQTSNTDKPSTPSKDQSLGVNVQQKEEQISTPPKSPTPAPVVESNEDKFNRLKDMGNDMVKKNDYSQAVAYYTEAIDLYPDRVAPYSNRALCYLKLNNPSLAVKDCDTVLAIEPDHIKALFRRAQANNQQQKYKESLTDLMQLLKLEPKNAAAKKEADVVKENYRQQLQSIKKDTTKNKSDQTSQSSSQQQKQNGSSGTTSKSTRIQRIEKDDPNARPAVSSTQAAQPQAQNTSKKQRQAKKKQAKKAAANAATGTSTASGGVNQVNTGVPTLSNSPTAYEFTQAWNALKHSGNSEVYAKLLRQVPPSKIAALLSNKLEAEMLEKIVECLDHHFTADEMNKVEEYLKSLSTVPRFSMITMLISNNCKKGLENLFKKLNGTSSHVDKLRIAYGL